MCDLRAVIQKLLVMVVGVAHRAFLVGAERALPLGGMAVGRDRFADGIVGVSIES